MIALNLIGKINGSRDLMNGSCDALRFRQSRFPVNIFSHANLSVSAETQYEIPTLDWLRFRKSSRNTRERPTLCRHWHTGSAVHPLAAV
jgi:hypothetical protein